MATTELGQFAVSYRGDLANEILLEPVFFDSELRSSFQVMPNVTNRRKMQFVEKLENVVRKYTGCGFTPIGNMSVYDREIEVQRMKIDMKICWDEFKDTVFEELLNQGTRLPDLTGTQIEAILIGRIQQALRLDLERLAFFGNTKSNDPNYDSVDGLWTVYYPELVAEALSPRTNTGSGSDLSAGDGIDILRAVYDQAPNELKALPANQKVFNVTHSVYNQYLVDIEEGGGADYGLLTLINGVQTLQFRGIPVMPFHRWDGILTALGTTKPHYVEYTTPRNRVLATDITDPGTDLSIWYDQKDEEVYMKGRWKMGVNYVHHSLVSLGY
jgi:hypothetical protein